jgi:hypothetical protein
MIGLFSLLGTNQLGKINEISPCLTHSSPPPGAFHLYSTYQGQSASHPPPFPIIRIQKSLVSYFKDFFGHMKGFIISCGVAEFKTIHGNRSRFISSMLRGTVLHLGNVTHWSFTPQSYYNLLHNLAHPPSSHCKGGILIEGVCTEN